MKGKRTGLDFEKHEVIVTQEGNTVTHYLKKPDTRTDSVKFINSGGILAVTGDYGNWIFCREFVPVATDHAGVSDSYWEEKLRIASTQNPYEFDDIETIKNINRIKKECQGLTEEEREYLGECIYAAQDGDENSYNQVAHNNGVGRFDDFESVPSAQKKTKYWLLVVFDAFDEICRRMREEKK